MAGFALRGADGSKTLRAAEDVYKAQCAACHDAGMLGAPKFGDAGAWGGRIGQGLTTLATLTRQPLQEGCWQPRRISL